MSELWDIVHRRTASRHLSLSVSSRTLLIRAALNPLVSDFDLDLRAAEEQLDDGTAGAGDVTVAVLDGTTDPEEWVGLVAEGRTLLLAVDGDLNALAAPFAREVTELGGTLTHFRDKLVVTPPDADVDTSRLG
jgi:hypothetical protein